MAVWAKCRQCHPSPFSKSHSTESRRPEVPSKKLDADSGFRATTRDVPPASSFCARWFRVAFPAFLLKQQRCPHCERIEPLNRHSVLRGNDSVQASGQTVRGQRVLCSNRGQPGRCGKTLSLVVLMGLLPRHTLTASLVWQGLVKLLAGLSDKATVEKLRLPFAFETLYQLGRRLQRRLDLVRTRLCREQSPTVSRQPQPYDGSAAKFRHALGK